MKRASRKQGSFCSTRQQHRRVVVTGELQAPAQPGDSIDSSSRESAVFTQAAGSEPQDAEESSWRGWLLSNERRNQSGVAEPMFPEPATVGAGFGEGPTARRPVPAILPSSNEWEREGRRDGRWRQQSEEQNDAEPNECRGGGKEKREGKKNGGGTIDSEGGREGGKLLAWQSTRGYFGHLRTSHVGAREAWANRSACAVVVRAP